MRNRKDTERCILYDAILENKRKCVRVCKTKGVLCVCVLRASEILRGRGENHGRIQVKTGTVEDEEGRGGTPSYSQYKGASAKQKQDPPSARDPR